MTSLPEKTVKERSPLYPVFSINETLNFVQEIVKIGGKKVSVETVATVIGMSIKTNSFKSKISTAKQFGLIRGSGGAVELTDLAKRIVYAVSDYDKQKTLVECFLSAPLYRKIAERYENQAVPPVDKLGNILLLEYGVTKSAKDTAAGKFIESAEQIGILKNGIIFLDADEDFESPPVPPESSDLDSVAPVQQSKAAPPPQEESGYRFTIPTLSGSMAHIIIPQDVTEKDLDFITLYIQNMLPTFISNLKEALET